MAFPWMLALKVIPWGDVIEHAPKVLNGARKLLDKEHPQPPVVPAATGTTPANEPWRALQAAQQQLHHDMQQLAQTTAALAEHNSRLVQAVEVLRWRTRWLGLTCVLLLVGLLGVAAALLG